MIGRALEVTFVIVFFVAAMTFLGIWVWTFIHRTRRAEQKQDELDGRIKWD